MPRGYYLVRPSARNRARVPDLAQATRKLVRLGRTPVALSAITGSPRARPLTSERRQLRQHVQSSTITPKPLRTHKHGRSPARRFQRVGEPPAQRTQPGVSVITRSSRPHTARSTAATHRC